MKFLRLQLKAVLNDSNQVLMKPILHSNYFTAKSAGNGRAQEKVWLRHADAVKGMTIELEME